MEKISIPNVMKIVIYVPPGEVGETKEHLGSLNYKAAGEIDYIVAASECGMNTKMTAAAAADKIDCDSDGDVLSEAFTGDHSKFGRCHWALRVAISRDALRDYQNSHPSWDIDEQIGRLIQRIGLALDGVKAHNGFTINLIRVDSNGVC